MPTNQRLPGVLGSTLFFCLVPTTVAGLVPWWITGWSLRHAPFGGAWGRVTGALLVVAGVLVVAECTARFAWRGLGTPAPFAPTRTLVVTGCYRYVRNPMYAGVLAAIAGQALFFGSGALFAYAAAVGVLFAGFVVLHEEPALRRRFGASYDAYCAHVPRFLPRRTPWRG